MVILPKQAAVLKRTFNFVYRMIKSMIHGNNRLTPAIGNAVEKNQSPFVTILQINKKVRIKTVSIQKQINALFVAANSVSPIFDNTNGKKTIVIPSKNALSESKNQFPSTYRLQTNNNNVIEDTNAPKVIKPLFLDTIIGNNVIDSATSSPVSTRKNHDNV